MKQLQHEEELTAFIQVIQENEVGSYLEIGSKFGGSLWRIANSLPVGSRIVAVDLPHGNKESLGPLEECVADLKRLGYDCHLIIGDSTDPGIVERVRNLGPFDACFIDANHTLPYVTKDWENYAPMAKMIAFHDIAWKRPPTWKGGLPINVPEFWNEIKQGHPFIEIKMDPTGQDNGIGIIWPW